MSECLIVLFRNQPILLHSLGCDISRFSHAGTIYRDSGYGHFTGFYDWLRNNEGTLIGVRFHPLIEELQGLREELVKRDYIQTSEETNGIDIFFSSDRNIDLPHSADQDFENSKVLFSEDKHCAISFGLRPAVLSLLRKTYRQQLIFLKTPNSFGS